MKQFFQTFIASFLGVMTAIFLMFCLSIVGIVILGGVLATSTFEKIEKKVELVEKGVLYLPLNHVVENLKEDPIEIITSGFESRPRVMELRGILHVLNDVEKNDKIKGVLIQINRSRFNWVIANEIRLALSKIKNKPVVVYTRNLSEKTLFVSSAASKIYMMPYGGVSWNGMSVSSPYLKSALNEWNLKADVIRAGKFKSAGEMFVTDEMSEDNREQIKVLLGGLWGYVSQKVSEARQIDRPQLEALTNQMAIVNPEDALAAKLIDGLMYFDQVKKIKIGDVDFSKQITMKKYTNSKHRYREPFNQTIGSGSKTVAVLYVDGSIVDGYGDNDQVGSDEFYKMVEKIKGMKELKALVVRVNSPGGSASAAEEMHRALKALKEKNKNLNIVVSFAGMAASGGYYLAAGADQIFADPLTVTGSIGVFALHLDTSALFKEKFKVNFQSVKTNQYADFLDGSRPLSDFEKNILQGSVNRIYNRFVTVVSEGRKKTFEDVNKVAQGRVWTGLKAQQLGLVDRLGGVQEAISYSAEQAGLDKDYQVVVINDVLSKWKRFVASLRFNLKSFLSFPTISSLPNVLATLNSKPNDKIYMFEPRFDFRN